LPQEEAETTNPHAVDALERLVDEKVLAKILDVSPGYLANLRYRGGGPRYYNLGKPGRGRCIRYRPSEALAWVESRAAASTTECRHRARSEVPS
jgi:hypothetical protein